MTLLVIAIVVLMGSGVVALVTSRRPQLALVTAAAGAVAAGVLGLPPAFGALRGQPTATLSFQWAVPGGEISLGLDPLTAFFLVPLLALGALCALYALSYMRTYENRRALGPPAFFFNVTLAAMMLVLVARHALVLLVAWELMTLASYLLVTFEHEHAETRRAGWVYLIAGHVGIAFLLALFLTLGRGGDLSFASFASSPPAAGGFGIVVFVLALVGFGLKAGVVPLHVWLPEAHAAAPSHVSALMSGVLIKLGLYGLLRVLTLLAPTWWHGPVLIVLGLGGGLIGISLALYQRDIKRTLAYSSIENVGVILLGLGVGLWGARAGHAEVAALGIFGGLLHVWNHAVMKSLMFLAAGSVVHGAGCRDMERLGGLLQSMPWTGSLMILGSVAIAGLPPLAGFVGEWLIYIGLLKGGLAASSGAGLLVLLAAAGLATIGALAALCFVRLVGTALLGQPRSREAAEAHESGLGLVTPLLVLASTSVAMALGAGALVPLFAAVAAQVGGETLQHDVAALQLAPIELVNIALIVALLVLAAVFALLVRGRREIQETWGCGYLAPTARMQYTGRSFAAVAAERLLPPPFRLTVVLEKSDSIFPSSARLSSDTTDPLTRTIYEPFLERWGQRFSRLRWLQQGVLHAYLTYILAVLVAALVWTSVRRWWLGQ